MIDSGLSSVAGDSSIPRVPVDVKRSVREHPGSLITASDSTVGIGQLELRFGAYGRLRAIAHPEVPAPSDPAGS
jgi:hypothetical protein